ncbi:MAG: hypothetical protein M5U26_26600 [Planctomycetota bacterium]|nr:hypothetical protein [Planctomycetota bacterium]
MNQEAHAAHGGAWSARLDKLLPILAGAGLLGSLAGAAVDLRHTLFAYLVAFLFGLTIVLGMLFFVMIQHLTDAGWSTVLRRPAEQFLAALPVLALLLLPVLLGMQTLYKWTNESEHANPLYLVKKPFLNVPFFIFRAALYFLIWILLARIVRGKSLAQDASGDPKLSLSMRRASAPGMYLYAFSVSFAGIDWAMTLDYHWFSTMYGVYIFAGAAAAAMATLSIVSVWLHGGPLKGKLGDAQFHDLGKLLFAFCCFWAYIAFSQFFLIWYANVPEETGWMLERWNGDWKAISTLLALSMWVVPFVVLMPAAKKRHFPTLVGISSLVLFAHYVDLYWLVMPVAHPEHVPFGLLWVDAATLCLVAGALGIAVLRALKAHPLYPVNDPRLNEALIAAHGHGHEEHAHPAAAGD